MFDVDKMRQMYDEGMRILGQPPLSFALFDRRVLFPRSTVVEQIEQETGQRLTLSMLDDMAQAELFTWLGGAGGDDTELGVPVYVPSRLGLFAELEAKGWTRTELRDFTEWEEWVIDDCMADCDLSYEDNDVTVLARHVRHDLQNTNDEILGRLPADEQPPGWIRSFWSSELGKLATGDLNAKRDRLERYLRKVESTNLTTAPEQWRLHIGRNAFCIRFWEESVRTMLVMSDRRKLEAGFSPAVQFSGEHALIPNPENLEDFGQVDWDQTLGTWRFLEDPDHFPIRLPGFVLVGGKITLDGVLSPNEYAQRHDLFNLPEYLSVFRVVAGERRCAHCAKMLKPSASQRRRYCTPACSQAARQKAYRQRQKEAILRQRRPVANRRISGEPVGTFS
jgi:hypothetical protein